MSSAASSGGSLRCLQKGRGRKEKITDIRDFVRKVNDDGKRDLRLKKNPVNVS